MEVEPGQQFDDRITAAMLPATHSAARMHHSPEATDEAGKTAGGNMAPIRPVS